jgi:transposase
MCSGCEHWFLPCRGYIRQGDQVIPAKKYIVELEAGERERLNALISKGKAPVKTILKAHIPPRRHRYDGITYSKKRYQQRNLIERCFNKLKKFRHIAMRFDCNPLNYLATIKLASIRLRLRAYESAAETKRLDRTLGGK